MSFTWLIVVIHNVIGSLVVECWLECNPQSWCVNCYCVLKACWQIVYALPVRQIQSSGY